MSSFTLLLKWHLSVHRVYLPVYLVVHAVLALGIVVGFGYLIPDLDATTALFLSTGAPTMLLLVVGLVILPQTIGQRKTEGSYDWFRTLPVPRAVFLAADLLVWVGVAVPGMALAVGLAVLRYDVALSLSPLLVPALLLVGTTSATIGYGLGSLLPPQATMLVSQVLVFFTLLFSPVNFPVERLPGWLARTHAVLPVEAMADLMRATIASADFQAGWRSYALVAAWCAVGLAGSTYAMTRRV
jgi:ABC-2 type transport system permease protein